MPPTDVDPSELLVAFRVDLINYLNLAQFGMRFLEVKAEGLRAAAGATDFSVLFISFSFFIIASAAMLVGLLFSLGIQARAAEIGLLLAVGYTLKRIRRRMLGEGGMVAAIGALVGLAVGVGYAALMMAGLRTLWVDARRYTDADAARRTGEPCRRLGNFGDRCTGCRSGSLCAGSGGYRQRRC